MNSTVKNIRAFTVVLEKYFKEKAKTDVLVYSRPSSLGAIFLNNLGNNKKILIKTSESANPVGGARLARFIETKTSFKGKSIDNYIYVALTFKDNAIRLAKVDKRLSLITVNIRKKELTLLGSTNIDLNILNHFVEFADYLKFSISYDFSGILKHSEVKQKNTPPLFEIKSRTKPLNVFFSYSWDDAEHRMWVLKLAAGLIKSGINVLIDEWDLERFNNDLNLFMEAGIRDSDKVILICTPKYADKANMRRGGVGIENTIISGEFYDKKLANKYLPITKNYKKNLHECLPTYLRSKYSIDFNDENEYQTKFDDLVRKILNIPKFKKPELGKLPNLNSDEL